MKKLLLSVMCLAAMWSCNTQDPENKVDAGNVYMKLSLKMETKSGTTDNGGSNAAPGTEVGLDKENKVTSVDVALVKDDAYVVATVTGDNIETASTDTYIASFENEALEEGATYKVYIYANCKAPATTFNADATNNTAVTEMTKDNNFWMTNAYEAVEVTLPQDLSAHTQPHTPFNLGSHYVERSMARFDYMPKNGNKYELANGTTITLIEAAIINQSNDFYMLRRVSADGTNTNWTVGGAETSINYVVDVDWSAKAAGYAESVVSNFTDHMNDANSWDYIALPTGAESDVKDNWEGTDDGATGAENGNHNLNDYYIWQYVKENTIPGDAKNQNKGITTGVVFKGEITGDAVTNANGETIYVFENKLYGNWTAVTTAAEQPDAPATLVNAVNKISNITTPAASDYANAGFTGYKAEDGKYYAYYYYWNRHNDNADNSIMGVMEFAVVRNNVYKLCVDKIAKFGHPNPDDEDPIDPTPEKPEDPDEDINYYFNVTVKVLPWVVRVNHIEF